MDSNDDREALNRLFSLVYEQLHRLANGVLRRHYAADMTPTTLVNEAWLKLVGTPESANTSPAHFRAIAGRAMRQILIDAARRRHAKIHGGGLVRIAMDPSLAGVTVWKDGELLALDAALHRLQTIFPRQVELVEAKFFGGFSWYECAEILGISEATAMRDWRAARAWLAREIRQNPELPANPSETSAHGTGPA